MVSLASIWETEMAIILKVAISCKCEADVHSQAVRYTAKVLTVLLHGELRFGNSD